MDTDMDDAEMLTLVRRGLLVILSVGYAKHLGSEYTKGSALFLCVYLSNNSQWNYGVT